MQRPCSSSNRRLGELSPQADHAGLLRCERTPCWTCSLRWEALYRPRTEATAGRRTSTADRHPGVPCSPTFSGWILTGPVFPTPIDPASSRRSPATAFRDWSARLRSPHAVDVDVPVVHARRRARPPWSLAILARRLRAGALLAPQAGQEMRVRLDRLVEFRPRSLPRDRRLRARRPVPLLRRAGAEARSPDRGVRHDRTHPGRSRGRPDGPERAAALPRLVRSSPHSQRWARCSRHWLRASRPPVPRWCCSRSTPAGTTGPASCGTCGSTSTTDSCCSHRGLRLGEQPHPPRRRLRRARPRCRVRTGCRPAP